jgi:hypothetical protein
MEPIQQEVLISLLISLVNTQQATLDKLEEIKAAIEVIAGRIESCEDSLLQIGKNTW